MAYYNALFATQPQQQLPDVVVTSDEDQSEHKHKLLAIKSVSDINVYDNSLSIDQSNSSSDEDDDEDDDSSTEENDSSTEENDSLEHQLSVIYEEDTHDLTSEHSKTRQDSEQTLISDDDDEIEAESTVTVKLPLKLRFSQSEYNEPITTITVQPSNEIIETHVILKSPTPQPVEDDVTFTVSLPIRQKFDETAADSDSEVSVSVSLSLHKFDTKSVKECDDESSSSDESDREISSEHKERLIQLLLKTTHNIKDPIVPVNVKDKIKSFEQIKSARNSLYLTDEEDSGVCTDLSRHTDSSECVPEVRKLNRYQRAATHSRLYQLLQNESNGIESNDMPDNDTILPHNTNPVNERLVKELVQSLLKRKQGKCFRNLPLDKLYAAAAKILHDDDLEDSSSTAFLSPLPPETVNSSAIQTPQEFSTENDYTAYYNTWANHNDQNTSDYDIIPSKTFKFLQESSPAIGAPNNKPFLVKCPRVLSAKNLHRELQRVTELRETPPHSPITHIMNSSSQEASSTEAHAT